MMQWGTSVILHLPDVLLRDYQDIRESLEAYTVHRAAASWDVDFRWTKDRPPAPSLIWSEADEAHLFAILPFDLCKGLTAEGVVDLARRTFRDAVAAARKAD